MKSVILEVGKTIMKGIPYVSLPNCSVNQCKLFWKQFLLFDPVIPLLVIYLKTMAMHIAFVISCWVADYSITEWLNQLTFITLVSMDEEFLCSIVECPWLSFSHNAAVMVLARASVIWELGWGNFPGSLFCWQDQVFVSYWLMT